MYVYHNSRFVEAEVILCRAARPIFGVRLDDFPEKWRYLQSILHRLRAANNFLSGAFIFVRKG